MMPIDEALLFCNRVFKQRVDERDTGEYSNFIVTECHHSKPDLL